MVAGIIPLAIAWHWWSRARVATVVVGGVVAVAVLERFAVGANPLGPGNYVGEDGVLGEIVLAGRRPPLLGFVPLVVVRVVALMSIVTVALAALLSMLRLMARRRRRRWDPPRSPAVVVCALTAVGFGALIVVSRALGNPLWDRYLLPIVPLVGILVLADARALPTTAARTIPRVAATATLVALAGLGLVYSVNSASFDGTRW